MEADLDKQEVLRPQQGELSGERLLNTYYVNTGSASSRRKKVSQVKRMKKSHPVGVDLLRNSCVIKYVHK